MELLVILVVLFVLICGIQYLEYRREKRLHAVIVAKLMEGGISESLANKIVKGATDGL